MPTGVEIRNDDGYIQLTDAFQNIVFLSKGTGNLDGTTTWTAGNPNSTGFGSRFQLSIPNVTGYPPIIALRCDVPIAIYRTRLVSGNWQFDIVSEQSYSRTNAVEWFAFGPPPAASPANFGLEVRTAAGVITYNSAQRPLVIKAIQGTDYGGSGSFNIGSGRKLALIIMASIWWCSPQVPAGTWQQFCGGTAIKTYAANPHLGDMPSGFIYSSVARPANYGWGGFTSGKWAIMAVDVTGY